MTQQTINTGTYANDRSGDSLLAAFTKINANFTELYTSTVAGSSDRLTAGDKSLILDTDGALTFPQGTTIATADGTDAFLIDGAVDKDVQIYTYSGATAHGWTFDTDGILELPNTGSIKQNNSWTRTTDCILFASEPAVDVIWSSTVDYISSVKLTIQLETNEIGDATGWHSQVCEAVIASRGYANGTTGYGDPAMIIYGVTYTSTVPLATFTVQRNPTTRMIEVVATRTAATDSNLDFRIHSVEMSTKD